MKIKLLLMAAIVLADIGIGCESYPDYQLLPEPAKKRVDTCIALGGIASQTVRSFEIEIDCFWHIKKGDK